MIDPIKRLRTCLLCEPGKGRISYDYKPADALADEIEAAYMKLPVDADGVPIRVGDELETAHGGKVTVEYVGEREVRVYRDGEHYRISQDEYAYTCRHVKPDTVESLLQELSDEVWNASCESQTTWSDSGLDGIVERYAERIREAVER